ncbi:DUF4209 domain-containing protein [uncultured Campylobacter sp.]|uniref:DUF4209 domain-containing protein n=1 Tax=uncultured Campylobacter sp. TaxID=218934 RepID=UPI00344BE43C
MKTAWNRKNINSLLQEPKIYELLGRDLTEELKFLLTEPMGLNYRNKICHGLASESPNDADIYIWWLCLKLVINNCVGSIKLKRIFSYQFQ